MEESSSSESGKPRREDFMRKRIEPHYCSSDYIFGDPPQQPPDINNSIQSFQSNYSEDEYIQSVLESNKSQKSNEDNQSNSPGVQPIGIGMAVSEICEQPQKAPVQPLIQPQKASLNSQPWARQQPFKKEDNSKKQIQKQVNPQSKDRVQGVNADVQMDQYRKRMRQRYRFKQVRQEQKPHQKPWDMEPSRGMVIGQASIREPEPFMLEGEEIQQIKQQLPPKGNNKQSCSRNKEQPQKVIEKQLKADAACYVSQEQLQMIQQQFMATVRSQFQQIINQDRAQMTQTLTRQFEQFKDQVNSNIRSIISEAQTTTSTQNGDLKNLIKGLAEMVQNNDRKLQKVFQKMNK